MLETLAASESTGASSFVDPLERSDREGDIQELLEKLAVPNAWELAPTLVAAGFDAPSVERLAASFAGERLAVALELLARRHAVDALLREVQIGASRIEQLVGALKRHVHLDQGPVQIVDVRAGLDDTLVLLRSKIPKNVRVIRDYAADLPSIQAFGSEINQVWTNLIDNAVDALAGSGAITIRAFAVDDWVVVEIEDDGPGIPEDIVGRVFDPFFTTKAPGKGMGLGLDISYGIVVQRHRGEISVESRKGRTSFRVRLPKRLDAHG